VHSYAVSPRQAVECFHLVFLRALTARLEGKSLTCLKGGANLRFFMRSVRYSEDMDFDVAVIAKATLAKKVDDLLEAPLVVKPLAAMGLELHDSSKPKQTDTTQRWKAGIRIRETREVIRTRLKFSRRRAITGGVFEAMESSIDTSYGMPPFPAMHYPADRAIVQKIHALSDRSEPQPRDVFDLQHLFAVTPRTPRLSPEEKAWLPRAIENAMTVSFDDYVAKVVAYMELEQAEAFASREAWEVMQVGVVERLEALAR
jgi:predicted nucleotidyltransferase component of viral defense system